MSTAPRSLPGQSGLLPLTPDPRDQRFTEVAFGAAPRPLPVFPKSLFRERKPAKDQDGSLSCTQHAIAAAAEYQDGIELDPAWGWMKYCESVGTAIPNGASPRDAMRVAVKHGILPHKDSPFHFPHDDYQTIGNPKSWEQHPDLAEKAEPFKKAAYVPIQRIGDTFDSIRAALFYGQQKGQTVLAFGTWRDNWDRVAVLPEKQGELRGFHAYVFIDFETFNGSEYLVLRNSYGSEWGDEGYQYMSRDVANREFSDPRTSLWVFEDLTPEQIARAKEETVYGRIQRAILQAWWALVMKL